jgi:hypothetical protein
MRGRSGVTKEVLMRRRKLYLLAVVCFGIVALAVTLAATAGGAPAKAKNGKGGVQHTELVSESALLTGLASHALFPFLDTTPNTVRRGHVAVTDSTATCAPGAAAPANIQVLVGQAGVALTNVMTASTNTGIGTATQCVFHVTVRPGQGGVPSTITDIVVRNAGGAPLSGSNTVTASANVRTAR